MHNEWQNVVNYEYSKILYVKQKKKIKCFKFRNKFLR